ncbi:MAG: AAA family ATPase, partial [Prevotellaceae bacterium]|nr:AAA family ATPase [Prevotellaceae bacterium]
MDTIKELPYGISDFKQVIGDNYYYVDKSRYLAMVEKSPVNLLFIRPRRFGKSLFLGMLDAYYDIEQKSRFDEVFGNLWIGTHRTKNQGRFQVLWFDFSNVGGAGSLEGLEKSFNSYCGRVVNDFMGKYAAYYPTEELEDIKSAPTARDKLITLDLTARRLGYPLYLIIDEYDNFTNIVLGEHGKDKFEQITHASGFYRDIFKIFKGMFYRIFLTGVSPVTLDDLTSGFNIDWNISTTKRFNAMLGFSETEVREMFQYYKEAGA